MEIRINRALCKLKCLDRYFKNPLAILAGLDKNAEIVSPLFALGPAIVEIVGVTPLPQEGNRDLEYGESCHKEA